MFQNGYKTFFRGSYVKQTGSPMLLFFWSPTTRKKKKKAFLQW